VNAVIKDCWNTIGVRGDSSCKELVQYIHCRNCPVYSSAAAHLLDREPTADYIAHWTEQARRAKRPAEQDAISVLIFRIRSERFALATKALTEIASLRPIHSIPHRRNGVVLGVANIRGELLVCLSLHEMLSVQRPSDAVAENGQSAAGRFLVIQRDGTRAVCPVDEVHGIERVLERDLGPTPATVRGAAATYTRALLTWKTHTVGLLDEQVLFQAVNRSVA
jgi:chemotaxis-related protein WspD